MLKHVEKNQTENDNILDSSYESQLLTIRQFCSKYPWPSEAAMRAYVYKSNGLGIEDAFTRVGRRVLINPKKFFALIKQLDPNFKKKGTYEIR